MAEPAQNAPSPRATKFKPILLVILSILIALFSIFWLRLVVNTIAKPEVEIFTHGSQITEPDVVIILSDPPEIVIKESQNEAHSKEMAHRLSVVREMTRSAWAAYTKHAWGSAVLKPNSKMGFNESSTYSAGLTIVKALSTLWIMDLDEEYQQGRQWVKNYFDVGKIDQNMLVARTVKNYLGSFLSCYALTNDKMFLDKAKQLATVLMPAFQKGIFI